ncbi:MAG: NAD(P)-dependent oxidoreductase, partial [Nitrososphaerota archaeon]
GFIGLGLMGKPMATRLLKAGYRLVVYNRSSKPVEELTALGAIPASSPREVAERSEFVITMLPDNPDVRFVIAGSNGVIEGVRRGMVVIDMSTVSPYLAQELHKMLADKGVDFLDAPVSGSTMAAETGTLTIMVGGKYETYERALPIFRSMGDKIFYMGGPGMGAFTKLCNQIAVSLNLLATCEALLLAKKVGLDQQKVIEVISTGAGSSWQLTVLGPRMIKRDFTPGFKVQHLRKDLRIIREIAEQLGLSLLGTNLVAELIKALDQKGHGLDGTQSLITLLEELAGLK